jgi:hypothetical protein
LSDEWKKASGSCDKLLKEFRGMLDQSKLYFQFFFFFLSNFDIVRKKEHLVELQNFGWP